MNNVASKATSIVLLFATAVLAGCTDRSDENKRVHVTCFSSGVAVVDEVVTQDRFGRYITPNGNEKRYPVESCSFEKMSEPDLRRGRTP